MSQQNVIVSDQWAVDSTGSVSIETPLQHAEPRLSSGAAMPAGVTLTERELTGLLTLRAGSSLPSLRQALRDVAGLELAERLQSTNSDTGCLRWMAPDEWLLSCSIEQAFDIETRLRDAVSGHLGIVNVSAGYTLLDLWGVDVLDVLKKSTAYDVHPRNLPPGKVVNTTFAKTQVTLRCQSESHYELIVRRSFAHYLWLWLQTAIAEYNHSADVSR